MAIKIRPSHKQFWAENANVTFVGLVLFVIMGYLTVRGSLWTVIPSACFFSLVLFCVYRWLVLKSYVWDIGREAIIERRGLFLMVTDHIELYRIVDYQEYQTLLQRMLGIKNVVLVSTDKLNSVVVIRGIESTSKLINLIRNRVEMCKLKKRIYEVTNN